MTTEAARPWHRLIPGVALSVKSLLEGILNGLYGTEDCTGDEILWLRTGAFLFAWFVGLFSMKWDFSHGYGNIYHGMINVTVVTSWLIAVSDYPLACWIERLADSETTGLNETHTVNLNLIQLFLMATIEAASALELFWYLSTVNDQQDAPREARVRFKTLWHQYISPIPTTLGKCFGDSWPDRIPGVAITLQTTLSAAISSSFVNDDLAKCEDDNELIWRIIALVVSFVGGLVAMLSDGCEGVSDFIFRLILVVGWLVAVSDVPLSCWVDDDELLGWIRAGVTVVILGFVELAWNNPPLTD